MKKNKIIPSEKEALENPIRGNEQQDYYKQAKRPVGFSKPDRLEKVGKAKRALPSAKQVVFQSKINIFVK